MGQKTSIYNDLGTLTRLRGLFASSDPLAPPEGQVVFAPSGVTARRVVVLAGSFNPLTIAHTALAAAALRATKADVAAFSLSKVTIDKEHLEGALPEDRLVVLSRYARRHNRGVLLVNRGLYVDQAIALRGVFPDLCELFFVVGFDKIVQVFDPRYYADREPALEALFGHASFLVAPRETENDANLAVLLDKRENRPYRDRVRSLPLPPHLRSISSNHIRREALAGRLLRAELPPPVPGFIAATGAYCPPIRASRGELIYRYRLRQALLDLLYAHRAWSATNVDLPRLLHLVWGDHPSGRRMRELLQNGIEPLWSQVQGLLT